MDTSSSWQVGALVFVGSAVVAFVTVLGVIFLALVIDGAVAVGRRRRAANRDLTRGFDS